MQITKNTNFGGFDLAIKKNPEEIIELVKKSELKGRGGANFPTSLKWELARNHINPEKILICNADEGEPGSFKDRFILLNNPEIVIEGIAIACFAIGADSAYIFLRQEYDYLKPKIEQILGFHRANFDMIGLTVELIVSAGAYICGDETAIIKAIENHRGEPYSKPPYPVESGLFGRPTVINNVETLAYIPLICLGQWNDFRLLSLSGSLNKPGVFEVPMGIKAVELIERAEPKEQIKALFFGCSGGCIPYNPNLIIDPEELKKIGVMLGSGAIIAVGESVNIPSLCKNICQFFVDECCGKCAPCREGNSRMLQILNKITNKHAEQTDFEALLEITELVHHTSLCGLGHASVNHIKSALKYFIEEF